MDLKRVSNLLFQIAAIVYVISLITRTVLTHLVYQPGFEQFSRPLAAVLQFLTNELQGLTLLPVVSLCIIAGIVLRMVPHFKEESH